MKTDDSSPSKNAMRNLQWISWCCALSPFLVGYATSSINGAIIFIKREMELQPSGIGLLTSCFEVGAGVSSILSGTIADAFGRKRTLLGADVLYILAIAANSWAPNYVFLVLARTLLGFAAGAINVIAPVMLAEFCTPDERAQRLTISQILNASGEAVVFIVGAVLGNIWYENDTIWRWIYVLAFVPSVPLLLLHVFIVPESPRWLAKMGRKEHSVETLRTIRRTSEEIEAELKEIESVLSKATEKKSSSPWSHLRTPWIRCVLLLGIGIAIIQQGSGISIGMKFGTMMLGQAGLSEKMALVLNVSVGLFAVGSMSVGLMLISRVPLRRMMMFSQSGIICAHLAVALVSAILPQNLTRGWITLGILLAFISLVQSTVSPVCCLLMNEIFPLDLRGFGKGVAICAVYATACILDYMFPILLHNIGQPATFGIFALIGSVALFFTFRFLPETYGKSLEELEQQFRKDDWTGLKKHKHQRTQQQNANKC